MKIKVWKDGSGLLYRSMFPLNPTDILVGEDEIIGIYQVKKGKMQVSETNNRHFLTLDFQCLIESAELYLKGFQGGERIDLKLNIWRGNLPATSQQTLLLPDNFADILPVGGKVLDTATGTEVKIMGKRYNDEADMVEIRFSADFQAGEKILSFYFLDDYEVGGEDGGKIEIGKGEGFFYYHPLWNFEGTFKNLPLGFSGEVIYIIHFYVLQV